MKKMSELREMSGADRQAYMLELLQERQNMRLRQGMGEGVKTHRYGVIRRMIARLKTLEGEEK